MTKNHACDIGSKKRWVQRLLVGISVLVVLLALAQPAAACSSLNPFCWWEEGVDFLDRIGICIFSD